MSYKFSKEDILKQNVARYIRLVKRKVPSEWHIFRSVDDPSEHLDTSDASTYPPIIYVPGVVHLPVVQLPVPFIAPEAVKGTYFFYLNFTSDSNEEEDEENSCFTASGCNLGCEHTFSSRMAAKSRTNPVIVID